MSKIVIWGRQSSVNVQLVLWTLAELSLDYQRHDAGFIYGVVDTPEFRSMNPNGLVPVLVDGTNPPIFESAVIVRYLCARYGGATLWPDDPVARALVDQWAEWAKWNVGHAFINTVFWKLIRTPAAEVDLATIRQGLDQVEDNLSIANEKLATSRYLAGTVFTFADFMLGFTLYRYYDIDIPRREFPHLRRYYDRLCERPGYQNHVIYSYDELRV